MGTAKRFCLAILCLAAACSKENPSSVKAAEGKQAADKPIDPVTDYDRMEDAQAAAGTFLKKALSTHLLKRDVEGIRPFLAADFRGRFALVDDGRRLDEAGVLITDFAGAAVPETDAAAFLPRLKQLVDRYATLTRSQFRCFTFLLDKGGERALARYHWWLSGRGAAGQRLEVQGDFDVELAGKPEAWTIRRLDFPSGAGQLIEATRETFRDITDATGFEFAYSAEGRAALQAAIDNRTMTNVGGLAAVDWNRDGFIDFIATNEHRRTVLFQNDGQGGFQPVELPEQGGLFYLFLDLDGDGVEELVSTQPRWYRGDKSCLGLYKRTEQGWKALDALVFDNPPTARELLFHHIAAGDANGDGKLDLFVTGYQSSRSAQESFNVFDAKSGMRDLLFINRGGLAFSEEAVKRGIQDARFGYVAEFFDYDSDSDLDLLVINDFGPDSYYANRGDGTFDAVPGHPLVRDPAFGMGLAISDFDNEGKYSIYVSNMYSHAGNRMIAATPNLTAETRRNLLFAVQGNALFESGKEWTETAIQRGIARADWAWGCVFFDLENDGDKDLFVANGFTTHSDPTAPDY